MERNILVLDKNTIDKIAAGEVVERPMSVVKELVENSIDSNATAITVEIKDGGTSFIRVTDNGCGIPKSEVKTAFLRHATSKIRTIEDLINVGSLGFRGEALSSIAAVSKVELLTKTEDEFTGTRYCIEGSREMSFDDVGVPEGTTFIVRALFYNTPARRKFLKTPQTEGSYVSDYMEKVMLSHPGIAFKLIINGNTRLQSSGNGEIPDIIYGLYGRDMVNGLLPIDITDGDITIRGYVCKPELSRGNRSFEIYYVNNRYIQSTVIRRALDEAYKPYLMLHKYPVVFLYIDISPELIDVNVHPAKKEIRFLEGAQLYDLLVDGIRDVLSHKELIPDMHGEERNNERDKIAPERTRPEPFETQSIFGFDSRKDNNTDNIGYENHGGGTTGYIDAGRTPDYVKEEGTYRPKHTEEYRTVPAYMDITAINVSDDTDINLTRDAKTYDAEKENVSKFFETDEMDRNNSGGNEYEQLSMFEHGFLSEEGIRKHRIIGQLFETYWLVEMDNKLYIIDQHAAHEKIKYERLIRQFEEGEVHSQMLNPPIIVTLSKSEEAILGKYSDNFRKVGFEIEQFGGNEYSIREIPTELFGLRADEYFHDLMDELMNDKQSRNIDAIDHRIATMACKSAVKGNNRISYEEAAVLIDELLTLDNPFNCPHGRPTIISFTKNEVEKMFKRIVT
ncbi:MAG: DNA mismatch repair endonuclease MutL [Lachnospiraceae bacterium]|nr:DNA mismatch repair endonuclease MutL [Lachnospiraceae bacterium]